MEEAKLSHCYLQVGFCNWEYILLRVVIRG
jgi:hypothetical protein